MKQGERVVLRLLKSENLSQLQKNMSHHHVEEG